MLSKENRELLEGFEKRMIFLNIIKYLKKHTFTDEIKSIFQNDQDSMDNLVLMVLVFIMDSTLRYGEKCQKKDIAKFIYELSDIFGYEKEKSDILTEYIVTDILRNSGKIVEFNTFNSISQALQPKSTIILTDKDGNFNLSDEVYEFLFRTKEIDSELDFSVSRFKLSEFIKRGNYSKALRESRELVCKVRNLSTQMDDFMLKCKINISGVSIDEYEEIIERVNSAFNDESQQLNDIRNIVTLKLQAIVESVDERVDLTNIEETEREIKEILSNIELVIKEQTIIYNKKFSLSDCYSELLENDLINSLSETFNFEKTIINPMQNLKADEKTIANLSKLLVPLYRPQLPRYFSIENFYETHRKLQEEYEAPAIDLSMDEIFESVDDKRNNRYIMIIKSIFEYINSNSKVKFSEYIESLDMDDLIEMNVENSLLDVMLTLYSMSSIDIYGWKLAEKSIIVPSGEFDLSYCLSELSEDLLNMKTINIIRLDEIYEFSINNQTRILINDFEFEVLR